MILCKSCKTKLIIILSAITMIFSYPVITMAAQVSLQWDKNKESNVAGYNLYSRKAHQDYNYDEPAWTGSASMCTLNGLDENTNYYFVVRAFTYARGESRDSVEVEYDYERNYFFVGNGSVGNVVAENAAAENAAAENVADENVADENVADENGSAESELIDDGNIDGDLQDSNYSDIAGNGNGNDGDSGCFIGTTFLAD